MITPEELKKSSELIHKSFDRRNVHQIDAAIDLIADLQRQLEEKTRLLATYEAQPVVGYGDRLGTHLAILIKRAFTLQHGYTDSRPEFTKWMQELITKPSSTAHLDALLAKAERKGMERAAEICEDISKNGRGGAGTCVRAIRAAAQTLEGK